MSQTLSPYMIVVMAESLALLEREVNTTVKTWWLPAPAHGLRTLHLPAHRCRIQRIHPTPQNVP